MSLAELELLALDPADPSNYDPIPDDEDDFEDEDDWEDEDEDEDEDFEDDEDEESY